MNLVYTPKFCITIVFDFAWDDYNTQGNRWLCKILGVKQGALWGVFHLNFRQLPVANVTTFSKISKKEDGLARFTQIFGNVFLEVFFPFNLCPGISRIFRLNGSHFANSTVSKTSPGNFSSICCCFQIFESFG